MVPTEKDKERLVYNLNISQSPYSSNDSTIQYGNLPIARWGKQHNQFLLRPMKTYDDYNTLGGQVVTKNTIRAGNLYLPIGAVVFSFDPNVYTTELHLSKVQYKGQDYYYFGRIPFGTKIGGSVSTANGRNFYSKYTVMPAEGWYMFNIMAAAYTGIHYLPAGANMEFYAYGGAHNQYYGRSMIYSATRPGREYIETSEGNWYDTGESTSHGFNPGTGFYYFWPERDHRPTASDLPVSSLIASPALNWEVVDVQYSTTWQPRYQLQAWMWDPPVLYGTY
jgi:hypothetical protein